MPTQRKSPLKVVTDETPVTKKRQSVDVAADSGDRLSLLVAMRARIAKAIDEPNIRGADLAALSRRLLEIAKDIDALTAEEGGDDIGDAAETPDEEWATS